VSSCPNPIEEDDMTAQTSQAGSTTEERRAQARVPLVEGQPGLFAHAMEWYARRTYGDVPDPGLAMLHNRKVLTTVLRFEMRVAKWDRLDPDLKVLAQMASAAQIGCSWCMDYGYWAAHTEGRDTSKLGEVPRWRESSVFTPLERRVLEYTEAVTATPPEVTDEMTEALRADLGDDGLVELTMMVAVENQRSRFNHALGLTSQGFKDHCEVNPRR
jgi:alkylhydroperoxidase family enzyme